jgi:hypothetical protein
MAYGIEITRPSTGNFVINSDDTVTGVTTWATGQASSVTFFSNDILLFKPTSVTSGSTQWITGVMTSSGGSTQCDFYLCTEGTGDGANPTICDYIVLRAATNATAYGNYGLQMFAADGTTKSFDSRIHAKTGNFFIDDVGSSPYTHGTTLHTYDAERYVSANLLYYDTMTNLIVRRGVRFSNGHATYGTNTTTWNQQFSPYSNTNPDSFSIQFSGHERIYGDY